MPCSNHTGEYLKYKCYSTLKSDFDKINLSESGEKIFKRTKDNFNDVSQIINAYHSIFNKLASFLTADHVFSMYSYHLSCMYINFCLNEQVKNSKNYEYRSKFQLFDDFAKKFATERKKDNYPGNSCESYIKELVGDEYRKKEILYKLYYYYTEHKKPTNYQNSEPICDIINLILWESREAKNYIKQDKNFEKRIRELKDLIQREKPHEEKCKNYNILNFMLPEDDSKPKVETSTPPVVKPILQDSLLISQQENLKHVEGDISRNDKIRLSETEVLGQQSNLHEEEALKAMLELSLEEEEDAHMEFLVVSMDHSKEDFQDMKIIMVEM
ncbi:hypothetical protein PVMG_05623 [Plasmodium vivax Mauritania I]|uniref:Variable surface protein n=1 Tax=Plasmodium vivax Mauritania I TaxID=1035515 RepID=A0A0J9TI72_PLAVI|nr:hypothetical protein PVMG_05623 [Plasmodium vivax Mauritania I]